MAYVLLWFPRSSETFIFREVVQLRNLGLPIYVYTIYGKALQGCSREMRGYDGPVKRFGLTRFPLLIAAFLRALATSPRKVARLLGEGCFQRMRSLETFAENFWCFLAGFLLAEQCRKDGIKLIHASWANGPATAAWVASRMTGIPFAFTGRAGDIYPEDGILRIKARDALFIRTNNAANVRWLEQFCPENQRRKVHLVYNGLTFTRLAECPLLMRPPYRLLAVGRLVPKKGFADLFTAVARLRREYFPVHLTLVGDGFCRATLAAQRKRLKLTNCIDMLGFKTHDTLRQLIQEHDLLVMPSIIQKNGNRDGIPNVIMEALSQRMPVVATDVCGIAEVIRNGTTGILVPPNNPSALSLAIRRILTDRDSALVMAEAGRTLVKEMFHNQKNIRALRDLYLSAAACGRKQ